MAEESKEEKIARLQKSRDEIWHKFCHLLKKGSFSGISLGTALNKVQQELDELEGNNTSVRYFAEVDVG
ncbi:MAG: hypothetical protein Q7K65_00410 [Candidatus Buchananbacteria bacterium]|nr:hypothetical protein [Candidatus Buchananbacteria bacterium]